MPTLGRLLDRRSRSRWPTLDSLAAAVGVTRDTVMRYQHGDSTPRDLAVIHDLAAALTDSAAEAKEAEAAMMRERLELDRAERSA